MGSLFTAVAKEHFELNGQGWIKGERYQMVKCSPKAGSKYYAVASEHGEMRITEGDRDKLDDMFDISPGWK